VSRVYLDASLQAPPVRLLARLETNENVYAALGRTAGARRLLVFFIYKPRTRDALILSAREPSGRKLYEKK